MSAETIDEVLEETPRGGCGCLALVLLWTLILDAALVWIVWRLWRAL